MKIRDRYISLIAAALLLGLFADAGTGYSADVSHAGQFVLARYAPPKTKKQVRSYQSPAGRGGGSRSAKSAKTSHKARPQRTTAPRSSLGGMGGMYGAPSAPRAMGSMRAPTSSSYGFGGSRAKPTKTRRGR